MHTDKLEADLAAACVLGLNHISVQLIQIGEMLEPEDFEDPIAAKIFFSTKKIMERDESIELLSIAREAGLAEDELLDFVIAMPLAYRSDLKYSELRMKATAQKILEHSIYRRKIEIDRQAEHTGNYGELLPIKRKLDERLKAKTECAWKSLLDAGRDFFDWLQDETPIKTIPTPWPSLNQKLAGGFRPGQMIVVAARPGQGKTVIGLNAALYAAKKGNSVYMISLEMDISDLMARMLAAMASVNLTDLMTKNPDIFSQSEIAARITSSAARLKEMGNRLLITEEKQLGPVSLSVSISQREGAPDLIVVDYLQLMGADEKTNNRQEEVAKISRGLKLMALEKKCVVIVLAQLNREVEKRSDKRPMLSDLRESGAIEQDADTVIMLYSEGDGDDLNPKTEFIIRKQRGGALGTVYTTFQKPFQRFIEESQYQY